MYRFEAFGVKIDSLTLLHSQELKLPQTGTVLVIGANGVGKTTFLKHIGRALLVLDSGLKISFVSSVHVYEKRIPLNGKEFYQLFSDKDWSFELINMMGHLLTMRIDRMSTGEFQALILIANFMDDADVFLIDEPTSHLSPEWSLFFTEWIEKLKKQKLLIVVSHQIDQLKTVSDQIYEIENQAFRIVNSTKGHHEHT